METLSFRPAPFPGGYELETGDASETAAACGCAKCPPKKKKKKKNHEVDESVFGEYDEDELDDEISKESCPPDVPPEITGCTKNYGRQPMQLCHPDHKATCPPIPMLWRSTTIAGVPFYYGADVKVVPKTGGKRFQVACCSDTARKPHITPACWKLAAHWIASMTSFGMPIAAVITDGAGPYCRCIKSPPHVCGSDSRDKCTGTSPSNHGGGNAIDVTGVVWKDPKAVGSSLCATVMHSYKDEAEQRPLLDRINAALRLAFPTVLDQTDIRHKNHFHVDTDPRAVFGLHTEKWFVARHLKRFGFLTQDFAKKPEWSQIEPGLAKFAQRAKMAVPSSGRSEAWRPVLQRLFTCVAAGSPAACRTP